MAWSRVGSAQTADRNLYVGATVFSATPSASVDTLCQVVIALGANSKNLSGVGGDYHVRVIVDGRTMHAANELLRLGSNSTGVLYTPQIVVGANKSLVVSLTSPNAAETGVSVTAELYADASPAAADIATAVWASGTRTLSSYGTLVADMAAAVWASAARTLTAVSDSSGVTSLLARLTSTRAGYLDKLANLPTDPADQSEMDAMKAELLAAIGVTTPNFTILPGRDRANERDDDDNIIPLLLGEQGTVVRSVTDASGAAVDLRGRILEFVVQNARGVDIAVVEDGDIDVSGDSHNTYSFDAPEAMTAKLGIYDYALNDLTTKFNIVKGKVTVRRRALKDASS